jgi:hypothetical protein
VLSLLSLHGLQQDVEREVAQLLELHWDFTRGGPLHVCCAALLFRLVINQKQFFFFWSKQIFSKKMLPNIRPITNIWHKTVNIAKKKSDLYKEQNCFLGWQLQVPGD